MPPVSRPYRGVSAEERRAERRERLIQAGFDVLAEDGVPGTTMKAVRIRAGLSERYFYESFKDRDELLHALIEALAEELRAALTAAMNAAPPDLYERSRAGAAAVIGTLRADPRKARTFTESARARTIRVRRAPYYEEHAALIAEQLRELGGLKAKRLQPRVQASALMLVFGLANTIAIWLDGDLDMTADALADHFARLAVAAVGAID